MNARRYHEIFRTDETQTLDVGIAKPGCGVERDQAVEMYELLRTYTYLLIGLGNAFRRVAGDFSGTDGSNWRNNRCMASDRLKALAISLGTMDPYDVDAILKIEDQLEAIARELSKEK